MNNIKTYKRLVIYAFLAFLIALMPVTLYAQFPAKGWKAGCVVTEREVRAYGIGNCFRAENISDAVFKRMNGKSFKANKYIRRADLRYLRLLHYDNKGRILTGEMVCNKAIANDLVEIFRELYNAHYPIERMQLIDDFGADDERSMRANNTTSFCYRNVSGSSKLSKHSLGLAVDINPLYNPHYKRSRSGRVTVSPSTAMAYVSRSGKFPYKIVSGDLLYRLFIRHGFRWGGAWRHSKDYQHFEK